MMHLPFAHVLAQKPAEVKDTLFFQQIETREWYNDDGLLTNMLNVKAQLYAPPRIYVKKDSLYKPTRVRVSFSFERTPEANLTEADTSQIAVDYALTILKIYQLYVNKIRKEYWGASFKKGQTLHLKEIMERNFHDMIEADLKFREETENGSTPDRIKYWSVWIQRELDSMDRKQ